MSRDQRSRLALVALLAVFLIPIGMSSLRGLTHILTCDEPTASTLSLVAQEGEEPILLGATSFQRGQDPLLCGGLSLDLAVQGAGPNEVTLIVPITNHSELPWRGTVRLELGSTTVPVAIGRIDAGSTVEDRLTLRLHEGGQEVSGALLIGP